jgi:hypothetical protein
MTGLSLGMNVVGLLGLAAEPVAEMMWLLSRKEPVNHITQVHPDGSSIDNFAISSGYSWLCACPQPEWK